MLKLVSLRTTRRQTADPADDKGGWHRQRWMAPAWSTNHVAATPIAEGTNRRSGGRPEQSSVGVRFWPPEFQLTAQSCIVVISWDHLVGIGCPCVWSSTVAVLASGETETPFSSGNRSVARARRRTSILRRLTTGTHAKVVSCCYAR